jgi:hypothetical protein
MKKLLILISCLLLMASCVKKQTMTPDDWMRAAEETMDSKVTALNENTSPISTDILYIVDDPGGSPASEKVTIANVLVKARGRLELTDDTSLSEAQILGAKYITNQGDAGEQILTLPDLEYGVSVIFMCEEAQNICLEPPAGESFDLDGSTLTANYCVDSDSTVGSKIVATRMKDANGDWIWCLDTIRGTWTDSGGGC